MPAPLLVSVLLTLVSTFVTLILTPETAAPLESVTVPLMVPNSPCAIRRDGHNSPMDKQNSTTAEATWILTIPSAKKKNLTDRVLATDLMYWPNSANCIPQVSAALGTYALPPALTASSFYAP